MQELTAAQKKKLKKKAKDKAKKADDKEGTGKKGPAKKESAAVRKLREDLERQKAEQEAAQKAEEERIRQVSFWLRLKILCPDKRLSQKFNTVTFASPSAPGSEKALSQLIGGGTSLILRRSCECSNNAVYLSHQVMPTAASASACRTTLKGLLVRLGIKFCHAS